jgi:hypothetical protein
MGTPRESSRVTKHVLDQALAQGFNRRVYDLRVMGRDLDYHGESVAKAHGKIGRNGPTACPAGHTGTIG